MPTLQNLLQKADSYKERIASAFPIKKETLKTLDDYFCAAFTYSSNALEGNPLTISETKLLLEDGTPIEGLPLKNYNEAIGHRDAYDFMLELAREKDFTLTEETIKKLHRLFYQKIDATQAGEYRTTKVHFSGEEHSFPIPEEVPRLMKHLTDQIYSSRTTLHPIELAAMAHKRLIDIHPFIDGNGQTARLLLNLILSHTGYGVVLIPPARRNDYIHAMSDSRKQNDIEPFSKFIAECVIETEEQDYFRRLKLE